MLSIILFSRASAAEDINTWLTAHNKPRLCNSVLQHDRPRSGTSWWRSNENYTLKVIVPRLPREGLLKCQYNANHARQTHTY